MEAAKNVNMPIVVHQIRQNHNASANSGFSGIGSLPLNLEIVKRGNELSYRHVRRPESQYIFDLDEDSSSNYSTTNFGTLKDSLETATFEADFSNSITQNLVANDEDLDDSFFYGIQVIEHQPRVIFSQKVELKLNELEKWRPQITIDSFLLDDDE